MSRTILALSTVALLCASSQIALADESGAIREGSGRVAGAVVGGPVGAVVGGVGGAAMGNSMSNHRRYHRGYASCALITTTTINTDQSTTSGARTWYRSRICRGRHGEARAPNANGHRRAGSHINDEQSRSSASGCSGRAQD